MTILIDPSKLIKYREFDRKSEPVPACIWLASDIEEIESDIKVNGIKEPLKLDVINGVALLVDGNHRLSIALDLGLTHVPVNINYVQSNDKQSIDYYNKRKSKYVKFNEL